MDTIADNWINSAQTPVLCSLPATADIHDNPPEMGTVTTAFARALISAADLELAEDGRLLKDGVLVRHLPTSDASLPAQTYYDLVDWVRQHHPDRVDLPIRYARAVDIDNLGALGLAIKTAPTLRQSLQRVERYFRILTDTVAYRLHEACRSEPVRTTATGRAKSGARSAQRMRDLWLWPGVQGSRRG